MAPVLIIAIAVAGLVFGADAARGQIVAQLQGLLGQEGAVAIQALLKSASQPAKSVIASVIGTGTLVLGAMGVFNELQNDLDRIWRAPAAQQKTGIWALLRARLLTFGMILVVGFLLLVSLVLSAGLAALGKWWGPSFGTWEVVLQIVNFVVSFGIVTLLFAFMYKILPRVHVAWRDVWIGAAVTSLLFGIGKIGIGLYLGKSGVTSGFGAAGSIVVLLVWVYYSSQIFLLGAEFTWVFAHRHGSRAAEPSEPAPVRSSAAQEPASTRPTGKRGALPSPGYAMAHAREAQVNVQRPSTGLSVSWWVGVALTAVVGWVQRRRRTRA